MLIILGLVMVLLIIGAVVNGINKSKANAYLAKKYDEEKKTK